MSNFNNLSILQKEFLFYKLKQLGYNYEQYTKEIDLFELYFYDKFFVNCRVNKYYLVDFQKLANKIFIDGKDSFLLQTEYDKLPPFDKKLFYLDQIT